MTPLESTVRDVVQRAREGDQVVMALLAVTRDSAKSGNPNARMSARLINRFIKKNPPRSRIGAEVSAGTKSDPKAVYAIWACPVSQFPTVLTQASPFITLWEGICCCVHKQVIRSSDTLAKAMPVQNSKLGEMVRRAVKIQSLRDAKYPISRYCPLTGWELGE